MTVSSDQPARRQRNPRGQGERLRDDIIEAASRLLDDPTASPLSLRSVARAVGVAATSVYLHFDDCDALVRAVSARHFGDLLRLQDEAVAGLADPRARVHAAALSFCEFGLAHPGHYHVMMSIPMPLEPDGPDGARKRAPGQTAMDRLVEMVAACLGGDSDDSTAMRTAVLILQQLHGLVSLHISKPTFPWPPLVETVADGIDRLLDGAHTARQTEAA
jgi:AcrR family transcriptional regulator